jgi:hypothetical protein
MKGMSDKEYQACISNLGLLEGEKTRLQIVCRRYMESPPSAGKQKDRVDKESHKGLLVLTNDNMIFMQQQGAWSSDYAQALRIPIEHVSGITSGGTLLKHIRVAVGTTGKEFHEFIHFEGREAEEVRAGIEQLRLRWPREQFRK